MPLLLIPASAVAHRVPNFVPQPSKLLTLQTAPAISRTTAFTRMSRLAVLRQAASQLAAGWGTAASCSAALQPAWRQVCTPAAADLLAAATAARPYWSAAVRRESSMQALPASAAAALGRRHEQTITGHQVSASHHALLDRNLLVDTLDTMKRFEGLGMSREQAEALTQHLTGVLCANREKLEELFVPKITLEKSILEQDAMHAGFRAEILKSQELQVATFTRDTERLQINLEKIRSEIRYEIDKLTASQRLDLNLEKGRMRDELQMLRDKSNELEIKMDKEVNSLKAAMEQSKNDTVKYVLGLMLALMTAGLGAARLLMH